MIKKLKVKNYKALRHVEIDLTPIHVLIGPNDTGKTSILEVLSALSQSVDMELSHAFPGAWKGAELVWAGSTNSLVEIEVEFDGDSENDAITDYGFSAEFFPGDQRTAIFRKGYIRQGDNLLKLDGPRQTVEFRSVRKLLEGAHFYHWDPEFLALPVALNPKRRFQMESSGFGLALCLDEILGFDRKRFTELENRFIKIFPPIDSIGLQQEKAYRSASEIHDTVTMLQRENGKGIYFKLKDAEQRVPASQASDGTLLMLAYLTILYLPKPPRFLLIEEPENGIHPKRLQDVLKVLRELVQEQKHTQIVMTTHSPYVLDLFQPDEVTLCTKLPNGEIKTTRLSDSPTVIKHRKIFTLGEIWTSEGDEKIAQSQNTAGGSAE